MGTALTKHFKLSHDQESDLGTIRLQDNFGKPCEEPKAVALEGEEREDYLEWIGVLVERINMALVPDHPGKQVVSVLWTNNANTNILSFLFLDR